MLLLVWQVAADQHWVNPMLTGRPATVWRSFVSMASSGALWTHLAVTLR